MRDRTLQTLGKIDIGMLSALHMLLRERSVSKIAERIGISQPAMSNALRRLRTVFDDPLIIRSGNTMTLTAVGHELLDKLDALIPEIEGLVQPLEFDPKTNNVQYNIVANDHSAMLLGPHIVDLICKEAPQSVLILTTLQNREMDLELPGEQSDLRLGFFRAPPESWFITKLMDDDLILIACQSNKTLSDRVTKEEFGTVQQLATQSRAPLDRMHFDKILLRSGLNRKIMGWVSNFNVLPYLIVNTEMVAIFPRSLALAYGERLGVRIIELPEELVEEYNISMAWPPHVHNDRAHRWLRTRIKQIISSGRPWDSGERNMAAVAGSNLRQALQRPDPLSTEARSKGR